MNCSLTLPVLRADKRYFPLNYRGENKDNWGIISDITVDGGVTTITLRSILQVRCSINFNKFHSCRSLKVKVAINRNKYHACISSTV